MRTHQYRKYPTVSHSGFMNQRGLTLIEVLCAMIILALGILALAPMVVLSVQSGGHAQDITEATMLAQDLIEQYRQLDSLPAAPYTQFGIDSLTGLVRYVKIENRFTDPTVPPGMKKVGVTVQWKDKAGVARQVEYATMVQD